MNKKKIILMIIILVFLITLFCNKDRIEELVIKKKEGKVIGFQVCGIGNGHITQSKVVYNILIKKFRIPLVIIYGRDGGFDDYYKNSVVLYKKMGINTQETNDMKTLKLLKEVFTYKENQKYELKYGVNNWINFWIVDWFNYRTKQYAIASQFALSNISVAGLMFFNNLFSLTIPISIFHGNNFSKYKFPSLIDDKKLDRSNINKKMIVAYSVSGSIFPKTLNNIAIRNPDYTFNYFKNYNTNLITANNIIEHNSSKEKFKEYLSKAEIVFCTSGNELIQECIYNKIPVATMPCSKKQFEQSFNFKNYVKKFKWADEMKSDINLEQLSNKNLDIYSKQLNESLEGREKIILDLISKL